MAPDAQAFVAFSQAIAYHNFLSIDVEATTSQVGSRRSH
jgi:hypothetical protein